MARVVLIQLLLFALPFLLYAAYMLVTRKLATEGGIWQGAPFFWLAGAGIVLTLAGLVMFAQITGGVRDGVYEPARMEDGRIIPGRIVPREEAGE